MRMQSGMKTGLDDPRAVQILTTEHWSLLSARTLGYQEMFFVTGHEPGADPGHLRTAPRSGHATSRAA